MWSRLPGFRRSDTTRKIAGTIGCVRTLCAEANVDPPAQLLITSHLPKRTSAAAGYLTWGVIRAVGEANCQIVVIDELGGVSEIDGDCRPTA